MTETPTRKPLYRAIAITAFVVFGGGLLFLWYAWLQWNPKPPSEAELQLTVKSAQPLIRAIRAFEKDHKRPPRLLIDLVPKYIARVPMPEGPAYGDWAFFSTSAMEGFRPEADTPWAIGIFVKGTVGGASFGDWFVYHASGVYETHGYSGVLKRMGDWGYYKNAP